MESSDDEPFEAQFSIYYDEVSRTKSLKLFFLTIFYLGKGSKKSQEKKQSNR